MSGSTDNLSTTQLSFFLDHETPNVARIFNYLLDGTANFEVDRQAAKEILQVVPSLAKWIRLQRAFMQESVQRLSEESVNQFVDMGSGLPMDDYIHSLLPEASIVYSDINPVAINYGQALFQKNNRVAYLFADGRNILPFLQHKTLIKLIDAQQPVAFGLNFLPLVLSLEELHTLTHHLYNWVGDVGRLFVGLQTIGVVHGGEAYAEFQRLTAEAGIPLRHYSLQETIEALDPWRVAVKEPMLSFLGLPEDVITEKDRGQFRFEYHALIMVK